MIWDRMFDRLGLVGSPREAAIRWMAGASVQQVGEVLGLKHRNSVYNWAREVGLPARQRYPGSRRETGALGHVGLKIHNARHFAGTVA